MTFTRILKVLTDVQNELSLGQMEELITQTTIIIHSQT